jgi:hypothetical protein
MCVHSVLLLLFGISPIVTVLNDLNRCNHFLIGVIPGKRLRSWAEIGESARAGYQQKRNSYAIAYL